MIGVDGEGMGSGEPVKASARPAWPVRSGTVPPLAGGVSARAETAADLGAALMTGAMVVLVPARVAGERPGGWLESCGKTQLAACVAESLSASRRLELLVWVVATSRASVLSSYLEAAAAMMATDLSGDGETVAARFVHWLGETGRPWLVVFDDLGDRRDLEGLWPSGPAGRVLVTTADPAAFAGEDGTLVHPVGVFTAAEAVTYLTGRLGLGPERGQEQGARELAGELGYEPLALAQASAVIASSAGSYREYRDGFVRRREQRMAAAGALPPAAGVTWEMSAEHAERLSPGGGTRALLALAALMDGHGVPLAVFTTPAACAYIAAGVSPDAAGAGPENQGLAGHGTRGLGTRGDGTRGRGTGNHHGPGSPGSADGPSDAGLPARRGTPETPRMPATSGLERVQQAIHAAEQAGLLSVDPEPSTMAPGRQQPGSTGPGGGEPGTKEPGQQPGRPQRGVPDPGGPARPVALVRVNHVVQAAIRAELSREMLGRAAIAAADALLQAWPEEDRPGGQAASLRLCTASLRRAAGDLLWADGCHPLLLRAGLSLDAARLAGPALGYWSELAAASDQALGRGHPDTLAVGERLAMAYIAAGQTAEAVEWYRGVLTERVRVLGPDHPGAIRARGELGRALVTAGQFRDAVTVWGRVLADYERTRGPAEPETFGARDELAAAHQAAGEFADATRLFQQTLAGRERVQGPDHPDTMTTRGKLAGAWLAAGKYRNALSHYKRTLADSERVLGPDHLDTIAVRACLAAAYHSAGRMAAALQLHEQNHASYERALGACDPGTLASRVRLARIYYEVGRVTDARGILRDTLACCERSLPPEDPLTECVRTSLAAATGEP